MNKQPPKEQVQQQAQQQAQQAQQQELQAQPPTKKESLNEQRLMQKTMLELKEIQARGRKTTIRTKYVRKDRSEPPPPKEKSKKELEMEEARKVKEIKAAEQLITYSDLYYGNNMSK
jgi:hypothetical protein